MSNQRLTDRTIKALKPKAKPYDKKDTEVRGLRVRVMPSGQRSFVLLARYPGSTNPTRRALGEYGVMTLEEARDKAREWRKDIKRRIDPAAKERSNRLEQARQQENTFTSVTEAFFNEELRGQRRGYKVVRDIKKVFIDEAGWGPRPITKSRRLPSA